MERLSNKSVKNGVDLSTQCHTKIACFDINVKEELFKGYPLRHYFPQNLSRTSLQRLHHNYSKIYLCKAWLHRASSANFCQCISWHHQLYHHCNPHCYHPHRHHRHHPDNLLYTNFVESLQVRRRHCTPVPQDFVQELQLSHLASSI